MRSLPLAFYMSKYSCASSYPEGEEHGLINQSSLMIAETKVLRVVAEKVANQVIQKQD